MWFVVGGRVNQCSRRKLDARSWFSQDWSEFRAPAAGQSPQAPVSGRSNCSGRSALPAAAATAAAAAAAVLSALFAVGRAEVLHFADGLLRSGLGLDGLHGYGSFRDGCGKTEVVKKLGWWNLGTTSRDCNGSSGSNGNVRPLSSNPSCGGSSLHARPFSRCSCLLEPSLFDLLEWVRAASREQPLWIL